MKTFGHVRRELQRDYMQIHDTTPLSQFKVYLENGISKLEESKSSLASASIRLLEQDLKKVNEVLNSGNN